VLFIVAPSMFFVAHRPNKALDYRKGIRRFTDPRDRLS
jgi:hypothetical protein